MNTAKIALPCILFYAAISAGVEIGCSSLLQNLCSTPPARLCGVRKGRDRAFRARSGAVRTCSSPRIASARRPDAASFRDSGAASATPEAGRPARRHIAVRDGGCRRAPNHPNPLPPRHGVLQEPRSFFCVRFALQVARNPPFFMPEFRLTDVQKGFW